mgnify:CR=1 FL=1
MDKFEIVSFEIKGLFGKYNHKITFDKNQVSIIIGKNGVGKTTVLVAIERLFSKRWSYFQTLPFDEIKVTFEDRKVWNLRKDKTNSTLCIEADETIYHKFSTNDVKSKTRDTIAYMISEAVEEIKVVSPNCYQNVLDDKSYNRDELIEEYGGLDELNDTVFSKINVEDSDFNSRLEANKTMMIQHQRIVNHKLHNTFEENIDVCSNNVKKLIQEKNDEFKRLTWDQSNNFISDFLARLNENREPNIEALKKEYTKLLLKQKEYYASGIIDVNTVIIKNDVQFNKEGIVAIELYLENVEKCLSIFEDIAEQVELFKSLINNKLEGKECSISAINGIEVASETNMTKFSLDRLSSGEKNEIILLCNLIFEPDKPKLVLIDEPEISLHIDWQKQFISDLIKIAQKGDFKSLVATHSPDIVDDYWNLINDFSSK